MKKIKVTKKGFNSIEDFRNRCGCWCGSCRECRDANGAQASADAYDNTYSSAYDHNISPQ